MIVDKFFSEAVEINADCSGIADPISLSAILTAIIGVITTGLSAILTVANTIGNVIGQHPVLSYFALLILLLVDGGISYGAVDYGVNWQGIAGTLISFVLSVFGVGIIVYSWQVLILAGISPIAFWVVRASMQ